ncbi:MAG: hypothetical protein JRH00_04255 [Deltaproteobacteria bacterium]|nr:hypothetical protein [Deltaproteobacteria bacterium]
MAVTEILRQCKAQGVTLHILEGNRLKVRGPKGRMEETLLDSIKAHKADLVRYLISEAFFDEQMDKAIADLDQAGINLMDYPAPTRHRAFVLEGKLTEAANAGDPTRFLDLLKRWRSCFN